MLIKFINDYRQIILSCAEQNYTKQKTEDVLLAIELYRYKKYQQIPRIKELNQIINTIYKTKSDENSDENNEKNTSYLWISEQDSCSACSQLDGQIFNEKPQRPHPNCNCEIKEISEEEADDKKAKHKENMDKRDKAVDKLNEGTKFDDNGNPKSELKSTGKCAKYISNALDSGGIKIARKESAYQHGEPLKDSGFKSIKNYEHKDGDTYEMPERYVPKKGDVSVLDKTEKHRDGHMAMYNGEQWKSDFKQKDMWGGSIRDENPSYTIYRNPDWNTWDTDK